MFSCCQNLYNFCASTMIFFFYSDRLYIYDHLDLFLGKNKLLVSTIKYIPVLPDLYSIEVKQILLTLKLKKLNIINEKNCNTHFSCMIRDIFYDTIFFILEGNVFFFNIFDTDMNFLIIYLILYKNK